MDIRENVELNSLTQNKTVQHRGNSKMVEIFSAMKSGNTMAGFDNKEVEQCRSNLKTLGEKAVAGDTNAQAELNSITTLSIEAPLMKRLSLVSNLGRETVVGFDEELRVETYQLQGEMSREQANSGSFVFPTVKKETKVLDTKTVTGGIAVNYREYASGAIDAMAYAQEQVQTDMVNKYVVAQFKAIKDGIRNATTMKSYAQGYTKANVDEMIKKIRRFGQGVTIAGDYEAVSEINTMAGFDVTPMSGSQRTQWTYSDTVMDEILKTGLLSNYYGHSVVEIPNTYDVTKLNADGSFYDTYIDTNGMLFIPNGQYSPLLIARRGGLATMAGDDLNTRTHMIRLDIEYGNLFIKQFAPMVGLIDKQ